MERAERVTFAHIITASLRMRAFTSEKVVKNNLKEHEKDEEKIIRESKRKGTRENSNNLE